MRREGRPVWPWRLFAWLVFAAGGLVSLAAVILTSAVGMVYIAIVWIALAGVLAYAYGHAARPLWFWRLFALLLSVYTMWDMGGYLARFAGAFRNGPEPSASSIVILAVIVPVNLLVCVALLRHAQLLRGEQRSAIRDLGSVFA
ncbi:MAG TPA: hypothetical protein VEW26_08810 [Allosphingosinicella sp.]|nr:hypothetical protein [Allosphingosinicella sp.]